MPTLLQKKQEELAEKNKKLKTVFDEAGSDRDFSKITSLGTEVKTDEEKVDRIKQMNSELTDLGKEVEELLALDITEKSVRDREAILTKAVKDVVHPGDGAIGGAYDPEAVKSLGQQFLESDAYKTKNVSSMFFKDRDMDIKTLMETTAGFSPESVRSGLILPAVTRPIQVTDLIPSGSINQAAEVYMEQTTRTNNAAEVAEGSAYGEAAFVYTERTEAVKKVGVWLPITDEQLQDEARISSIINDDLRFMLRQRLDTQILTGDGVSPNITGILNKSGIQTQAKGADSVPDAVYKSMTKVRVTGRAQPSHFITHPNDWQDVILIKTSQGVYIWGHPSQSGPERIWGLQVVQADGLTENTGIVGDFVNPIYSQLLTRKGIELKVTDSHSTDFINGKQAIRADVRVVYVIRRAAAFATVTGI